MKKIRTDIDLDGNRLRNAALDGVFISGAAEGKILKIGENGAVTVGDAPQQQSGGDSDIIAEEFSSASVYTVGDYVIHDGGLYRCVSEHQRAAWNGSHFEPTTVSNEFKRLPINHASQYPTYGVGNATKYGHVMLTDSADNHSAEDGYAATPKAVSGVNSSINALKMMLGIKGNIYLGTLSSIDVDGLQATFNVSWQNATNPILGISDYLVITYPNDVYQHWQWAVLRTSDSHAYMMNATASQSNMSGIRAGDTKVYKVTQTVYAANVMGKVNDIKLDSLLSINERVNKGTPIGMIVMWSGSINSIPTGWYLCDGTNGTPNLTEKFIVGVNPNKTNFHMRDTGGSATQSLDFFNIPAHRHSYIGDSYIGENLNNNNINAPAGLLPYNGVSKRGWSADGKGMGNVYLTGQEIFPIHGSSKHDSDSEANPSRTNWSGYSYVGDSQVNEDGAPFSILPPYFALAFIMFKG